MNYNSFDDYDSTVQITEWKNDTEKPVRFDLHIKTPDPIVGRPPGTKFTYKELTGKERIVVKPGEVVRLSSEYDQAVQRTMIGDDGVEVIIAGLAPQLKKVGTSVERRLHPALDDALAQRRDALEKAALAMQEKKTAEESLILARAKIEELEAEKAKLEGHNKTNAGAQHKQK